MPVTTDKKAIIEERRKKVAANLLAGLNMTEIAQGLGVSLPTVSRDVKAIFEEWREVRSGKIDDMVSLENARLDRLLNALWAGAVAEKKPELVDRILKIMERRAKLLGLDRPSRVEFRDMTTVPDEMLDRYIDTGDPTEIQRFLNQGE